MQQEPGSTEGPLETRSDQVEPNGGFSAAAELPSRRELHGAPRPKGGSLRWLIEILIIVVGAAILAVLLRMFVVQIYQIPSESMNDTLQIGSRIAVNRVPVVGKQVERGDVVVFQDQQGWLPSTEGSGSGPVRLVGEFLGLVPPGGEQIVVKRIIGVGGDTVSCCDAQGNLMVNGVSVQEPYLRNPGSAATASFEITVPEGYLWVMGDNRQNSADSLYHYLAGQEAFIPEHAVIGKAMWEIWPLTEWSSLSSRTTFKDVPSR